DAFRDGLNRQETPPAALPVTVPSDRFTVGTDGAAQTAVIDGGGWGHGIGMSQYGALGKALRGMKAADILAAYYGGLRPVTLQPEQLPARLRVALSTGLASAAVTAPGSFRVLDGAGRPLAVAATGVWTVSPGPAPGQVRVVPPPDQAGPPVVTAARITPSHPDAGEPVTVAFRVAPGARVALTRRDPDGTTAGRDDGVAAGAVTEALVAGTLPGSYGVTVTADAGGGRVTTVPLAFTVPAPAGEPAGRALGRRAALPSGPGTRVTGWPGLLAALGLASVVVAGLVVGRRRPAADAPGQAQPS
ncbi:MAG TPA: hypothetical protein VF954_03170, partial [Acidimicrobiales bacterium]